MLTLYVSVFLGVLSLTGAGYALVIEMQRRAALRRAIAGADAPVRRPIALKANDAHSLPERLRRHVVKWVPDTWRDNRTMRIRLMQAGFESETAVVLYAAARLVILVLLPLLGLLLEIGRPLPEAFMIVIGALFAGWVIPVGWLHRRVRVRQESIRRAIPDALDLLLVCVEAGVSFDSALMRVAREMQLAHPDMAYEFATVIRRIKAGIAREDALQDLFRRTQIEEMRTLVANVVQSERWGTSIGKVLRSTSDSLRRKRRQQLEKKAATAPMKMTVPLVLLILPPLFIAVLGPSVIQLIASLHGTSVH